MDSEKREYTDQELPREEERVELPFDSGRRDLVDWIYDHRVGLLVTVGAYLLMAIGIVTARISLKPSETQSVFYVDLQNPEQLMEEKERLEREVQQMQLQQQLDRDYYESIRNMASNEQGELNSGLPDARNTQASEIYDEAKALEDKMRASREAYERGRQEADNILNNRPQPTAGNNSGAAVAGKQSGNVTVSYSLPGRHATYLPVPAYQCQGGGEITIDIGVNRNGQVISASVASGSVNDACLREFALKAAQASTFNVDGTADARQGGTITYLFVPQ